MSENIESKKNVKKNKKLLKICLKGLLIIIGVIIIIGAGITGYIYHKYGTKIQQVITDGCKINQTIKMSSFNTRKPTQFYDVNGKLLKEFKTNTYYYTKEKDLNPYVFKAFVSIEDQRFYQHGAIDYKGTIRALLVDLKSKGRTIQGGSSITQQLARNVFLNLNQNMWRKLEEAVIAKGIEKKFTKNQILEFYVNNINFGNGCYSIESASEYYFQKPIKNLDVAQVAMLAGIPNNPSIYNPIKHFDNATNRKNLVLYKMLTLGQISKTDYDKAKREVIKLNVKPQPKEAPMDYAMEYAVYNATRDLMEQDGFIFRYSFSNDKDRQTYFNNYNDEYADKEKELLSGKYRVDTSIDMTKQQKLQEVVDSQLSGYTDQNSKTGLYEKQGASVTIDNTTGEVVAIVGGRSQDGNTFNRAFLGVRQPGSSIKPLVAYTPSFEKGLLPSSYYSDEPITNGPQNDDFAYRGSVSLRYAVDISINTIPVRLVGRNGVQTSLQYLQNMEFKYITPEDTSAIVGIGGFTKGVTPVEMASGYSALSRNGEFIRPTNISKITDELTNEIIYKNAYDKIKIYDSGASYLMTDVLKTVISEPGSTGYGLMLNNYPYVAGKTGTTDKSKDCWFVGYTPYYTTSVWVGDDTPAPQNMFGANEPGHIWKEYMEYLHQGLKQKDFVRPDTVVEKDGVLINTLYLEAQQKKDRLYTEQERIKKENQAQIERLNKLDYRIKYGLTKEQEDSYEKTAEDAIVALEKFSLTDKSQYSQIDQLVQSAYSFANSVKHQDTYYYDYSRIQKAIDKLNEIKYQIENPPKPVEQAPLPIQPVQKTDSNKQDSNNQDSKTNTDKKNQDNNSNTNSQKQPNIQPDPTPPISVPITNP